MDSFRHPGRELRTATVDLRLGRAVVIQGEAPLVVLAAETATQEGVDELLECSTSLRLVLAGGRAAFSEGRTLAEFSRPKAYRFPDDLLTPVALERLAGPDQALGRLEQVAAPNDAEAAVTLARLSHLIPALVVGARHRSAPELAHVDAATIARSQASAQRPVMRFVAEAAMPLEFAPTARALSFRSTHDGSEHLAIVVGDVSKASAPLVRVHSRCFTGDLLPHVEGSQVDTMLQVIRRLIPDTPPISRKERALAIVGALTGVLATGLLSRIATGDASATPWIIAPMGASAVLLFAAPASPLAQPWSLIGSNLVAALVGVAAARTIPDPAMACAAAIAGAIALMAAFRCLHPPSGAVALTAVLGGPAIANLGYGYALWPVMGNSLILLTSAILFNGLAGRSYPHLRRLAPPVGSPGEQIPEDGFAARDLDAALRSFGRFIDVDRQDLGLILKDAQLRAHSRRLGGATCRT
ncbi:hypothetical protein GCM10008174_34980 [Methylopila turkensis]|uniref:HPP family protein n=1 Tax=Methylopila turkensis TaxID=1437816 RepID=A0A9W6JR45_9HYPH|nr:hypothetical protein GCM10008174_34980 [Methylopila turkensis]